MLKNRKLSIGVALMLAVILMGAFHPARALAQCGGGDQQGMHEQQMGSYGQMGMGSGQIGMGYGQRGMGYGQRWMPNPQAPVRRSPTRSPPVMWPLVLSLRWTPTAPGR